MKAISPVGVPAVSVKDFARAHVTMSHLSVVLEEVTGIAPTPAKAGKLRTPTVEHILKRHHIRRLNADTVLGILRKPGIKIAASTTGRAYSTGCLPKPGEIARNITTSWHLLAPERF